MHLSNDSYGIEPLDSAPEQHLLYRLQDVTSQPRGCGTPHYGHGDATEHAQYDPEEIQHRQRSRVSSGPRAGQEVRVRIPADAADRNMNTSTK